MDKAKTLVKSKTFWFNILTVLIAVASIFGFADFEPSEDITKIVTVVNAVGNIILRLYTSGKITKIA